MSQASYFSRDDLALQGFSKYFEKASGEEREHGMKLMEYQVKRGGKVVFQDISKPTTMEWGTALDAMEAALELEKTVKNISFFLQNYFEICSPGQPEFAGHAQGCWRLRRCSSL